MTQRGFKDVDADSLQVFSGASSRLNQRSVVSERVIRKWRMATLDVKKTFLEGVTHQELGVTYQELAELTGEVKRDVDFEVSA